MDVGGRESTRELCFWQNARCTYTCRSSTFLRRGCAFPLAPLSVATRLYRFSISGWLSQAIKSTNTNNRKIYLWHSRHEPKAHVLLENCDLPKHTLEMRTHQRLPDCHLTVQRSSGSLSEYQLCMQCHPTHHHSHQRTSQRLLRRGHRHHLHTQQSVDPCHFMKLHFQCEKQLWRVQTGQNYQLLLQQLQSSWPWHLSLPAQHHTTVYRRLLEDVKTFNCCQCFHPQRLSYHSWPTRMQTHSKSDQTFQPAKYLECFRAENPCCFRYLKRSVLSQLSSIAKQSESTCPVSHGFSVISSKRIKSE